LRACLLAAGLACVQVRAADADLIAVGSKSQSPIVISLKQFKVLNDEKGETKFLDAALVLPGDVIEYRASYSNRGSSALAVIATIPIPESTEYLKESASTRSGIPHTVALKDAQFSKEPLLQKTTAASGVTLYQPIPYASYRYVRWDLGKVAPGGLVEVSVRAKVSQNLEADADAGDKKSTPVLSTVKK
jgi:uncharacterized repeat protein (TIGR01451 family)